MRQEEESSGNPIALVGVFENVLYDFNAIPPRGKVEGIDIRTVARQKSVTSYCKAKLDYPGCKMMCAVFWGIQKNVLIDQVATLYGPILVDALDTAASIFSKDAARYASKNLFDTRSLLKR